MDIYTQFENFIKEHEMIDPGGSVLAAVSGGADSMCMLSLLIRFSKEHGVRLGVVHVDHGFRPEAKEEAQYVREFCEENDIPFFLKIIEPGECEKSEEAARIRRYELIESTALDNSYDRIALAHNAGDRAETMLFNLFRGTGIRGLGSIRPKRDRFIRPVMCLERDEIEAYLNENGIRYYTDHTNNEDTYSRNRIRHHIIPVAEGINDEAVNHMNRTADALDEIAEYIETQAREEYVRILKPEKTDNDGYKVIGDTGVDQNDIKTGRTCTEKTCETGSDNDNDKTGDGRLYKSLQIDNLKRLHSVIATEVIRMAITDMTPHLKDITTEHIRAVLALIDSENGSSVNLPYGIRAYREYEYIFIEPGSRQSFSPINIDLTTLIPGGELLRKPLEGVGEISFKLISVTENTDLEALKSPNKYTKCFDYDKIKPILTIRTPKEGDEITIDLSGHTKTLKRYMIDAKIPRRLRETLPVIYNEADVLWVIGYRDSAAYWIDGETKVVLIVSVGVMMEGSQAVPD